VSEEISLNPVSVKAEKESSATPRVYPHPANADSGTSHALPPTAYFLPPAMDMSDSDDDEANEMFC